ncbi:DUF1203 domain-containing protein [Pelagibius marinus]|uniref:DUF1203 domain-containing protein n=1 Tax=Pelagibius marinus TaxID=2762760 RepID=UPI001D0486C8|nr:DUF1203 domain-containing protein [Pelagibius marinus]
MIDLRFVALDSDLVQTWRRGAPDANGQAPERMTSDGGGNPCRHCLDDIAGDAPMLVLAHRPFPGPQPYAEVGPIFVHAEDCPRYGETAGKPGIFVRREVILMRGYGHDDRIVYGSGKVIPTTEIESRAAELFEDPEIAYIHLRSASNNCFQCRLERG